MRSLPLKDALQTCAKIGYEAVELAALPDWPSDPAKLSKDARKALRSVLADSKMQLPALMENWPLDGDEKKHQAQLERLKLVADFAHELVPDVPPLIETILGGKPDQWDKVKHSFADRLVAWAKQAETSKVTIALKAHRFGAANRPEHIRWLLEQVKSKHLVAVYDWSHFEQRDMTIKDTVKALAPVTKFVHVKDTIMEKGQAKFVLPGDGSTDYAVLLNELAEQQYKGCVCVEVSGMVSNQKDYDGKRAAEHCYRKLAPAFAKIRGGKATAP
jgi:sugar phosphate isomerase/epimerase